MASGTKRDKKRRVNSSMKKSKKVKKASRATKKSSDSMKYDNIDVQTVEDVAKLVEHIKSNVVTLLLIYADWCGHCGTFKDSIWKNLVATKNRKVAMGQVNEKVLEQLKNHIPNLKIDGYPTNILVGRDMKAATVADEETGEPTNALPNTRDMVTMTQLVTADPSDVVASNNMNDNDNDDNNDNNDNDNDNDNDNNDNNDNDMNELHPTSASPTLDAIQVRNKSGNKTVNTLNSGNSLLNNSNPIPNPPNVEDDFISSQSLPVTSNTKALGSTYTNTKVGGSLYAALIEAAGEIAVPVALTATAIAVSSRKNKHKHKGSTKKTKTKTNVKARKR